MFKGSWKTTLGGIAGILAGITALIHVFLKSPIDTNGLVEGLGMIGAGWVGIMARDNNVTSEQIGAVTKPNSVLIPAIQPVVRADSQQGAPISVVQNVGPPGQSVSSSSSSSSSANP